VRLWHQGPPPRCRGSQCAARSERRGRPRAPRRSWWERGGCAQTEARPRPRRRAHRRCATRRSGAWPRWPGRRMARENPRGGAAGQGRGAGRGPRRRQRPPRRPRPSRPCRARSEDQRRTRRRRRAGRRAAPRTAARTRRAAGRGAAARPPGGKGAPRGGPRAAGTLPRPAAGWPGWRRARRRPAGQAVGFLEGHAAPPWLAAKQWAQTWRRVQPASEHLPLE
jgi:hypothetical protein